MSTHSSSEKPIKYYFSFPTWIKQFSTLTNLSNYHVISLPKSFLTYVQSDGVFFSKSVDKTFGSNKIQSFPQLESEIKKYLSENDNSVFIKLNWTSPRDAIWVNGTLQCQSLLDVFTLLKSSDRINRDIDDTCDVERCLVLKPYIYNILKKTEFRVYIKSNVLYGISQRYLNNYYPFLKKMKKQLYDICKPYWEKNIKDKFFGLTEYSFDIFIDYLNDYEITLVDFSMLKNKDLLFNDILDRKYEFDISKIVRVIESTVDPRIINNSPTVALPYEFLNKKKFGRVIEDIDEHYEHLMKDAKDQEKHK